MEFAIYQNILFGLIGAVFVITFMLVFWLVGIYITKVIVELIFWLLD